MKQALILMAALSLIFTSTKTWANEEEDFDLTTIEDVLSEKTENNYDRQRVEKYKGKRRLPDATAREYHSDSTNTEADSIANQLFGTKYGSKTAAVDKADLPKDK